MRLDPATFREVPWDANVPFLLGEFAMSDGRKVKPALQLLQERVKDYTPEWAEQICDVPAATKSGRPIAG